MGGNELARDIGIVGAVTIGIGTTLGAGIFVLPSIVTAEFGPTLWLPFALAGALAFVNAVLIAEFATALPRSGGAYGWINRTLGPLAGTVAGIAGWASTTIVTAFYCIGFGIYLGFFVPLPEGWLFGITIAPERTGALLAAALVVSSNYFGVRNGGPAAVALVAAMLVALVGFLLAAVATLGPATLVEPVVDRGSVPTMDLAGATAVVFVSYLGYAKLAAIAGEIRNPARTLPLSILGSLAVVVALYVSIAIVLEAAVDWPMLAATDRAIAVAAATLYGTPGLLAVAFAGVVATLTSAIMSVSTSGRIGYAMGTDRLVPGAVGALHPRFETPHRAFELSGLAVLALVVVGDLLTLALLATALHLVVAILSAAALLTIRWTVPTYAPPFSAPGGRLLALAAAVGSAVLLVAVGAVALSVTVTVVVVAVGWYLAYGRERTDEREPIAEYLEARLGNESKRATVAGRESPEEERSLEEPVGPTVLVPLANPETEPHLVELACTIADARNGRVVAIHVVRVPTQTPIDRAADRARGTSVGVLDAAAERAESFDVPFETYSVFSHRGLEEVFDAAKRHRADMVVMGWQRSTPLAGRAETVVDELASDLPADLLVLDERGFDPERILLPTTGTGNDALGAELARTLVTAVDSEVTLLHVVSGERERSGGERFLEDWAAERELEGVELIVDTSGDVEGAIAEHASDHTMLIVGATERGLLSRLVRRSLVLDVVERVDRSVVLTERAAGRTLRERLFGR